MYGVECILLQFVFSNAHDSCICNFDEEAFLVEMTFWFEAVAFMYEDNPNLWAIPMNC